MSRYNQQQPEATQAVRPYWRRLMDYGGSVYDLGTRKTYLMGELEPIYTGSQMVEMFGVKSSKEPDGRGGHIFTKQVHAKHLRREGDGITSTI